MLKFDPNPVFSLSSSIMGFSLSSSMRLSLVLLFVSQLSHSATVMVDGVSPWLNPHLNIGDSVIFQHKYHYNLYIFHSREAFSLCNFTHATILTNPNSPSYTWRTSRVGFFYFAFSNGSSDACVEGQKFAVKVSAAAAAPPVSRAVSPAPGPVSGGFVASSPAFPWPFQPRESASPSPAPGLSLAAGPAAPDREGVPFINSNPAVPLPTGEVDSATIRPLPTSGCRNPNQVVGYSGVERALCCCVILLVMMV